MPPPFSRAAPTLSSSRTTLPRTTLITEASATGIKKPLPLQTFPTPPWHWKPFTTPRSSPRTANTGNSRIWTGTPPRNLSTAASRTRPSTRNRGSPVTNPSSEASCTARASPAPGTAKAPHSTKRNRPRPTAA